MFNETMLSKMAEKKKGCVNYHNSIGANNGFSSDYQREA